MILLQDIQKQVSRNRNLKADVCYLQARLDITAENMKRIEKEEKKAARWVFNSV